MNVTKQALAAPAAYVKVALPDATHFRDADGAVREIVIVHTLQTLAGDVPDYYLVQSRSGMPVDVTAVALLKKVAGVTAVEYTIRLAEGEAQVLHEILWHIRTGAGGDHPDVQAICNGLWNELPSSNSVRVAGYTTNTLVVSKV